MTYSKMPLKTMPKWPKSFGFEIVGQGPCFVLSVQKDSIAYSSGLQPGDQLLELDNQDVTNMSADAVRTLAKHSRTQPPTIGVVSRLLHVDMVGNKSMGLGFTIREQRPVTVATVEEGGPAQVAGIRSGDIILEANGRPIHSPSDMMPLLPVHSRIVPITYIPVGKPSSAVMAGKPAANGRTVSGGSRVKRAKDLHDKTLEKHRLIVPMKVEMTFQEFMDVGNIHDPMSFLCNYIPAYTRHIAYVCLHFSQMNELLGEDYEKKMAVVGVLKQYAEDREVDTLARALSVILKTPQHRRLLRQIKPFIPPRQRLRFDEITRHQQEHMAQLEGTGGQENGTGTTSHRLGQRRSLRIVRQGGSFGFVIKGSNPAYIETVDGKGAAEKAGFQPGDFIMKLNGIDVRKCSHAHLVHLLQDSGTAPIIEILRCDPEHYPKGSPTAMSNSSASSTSSHAESDWLSPDHKVIMDKEGHTYLEKAEYLLTNKERSHVRKAWIEYESTCNVVELFERVSQVLDTPSKKTLWMFILARLSPPHQQYCVNQINIPRNVLLECVEVQGNEDEGSQSWTGDHQQGDSDGPPFWGVRKPSYKITSFQQQVEYLLTSRERSMLKKALQLYPENRNVDHLVEDLDVILDTPSKRTLWMYIVPLLTHPHQDIVRQRLHQSNTSSSSLASDPSQRDSTQNKVYETSEDDEHDLFSRDGERKARARYGHGSTRGVDLSLLKELEETKQAVQEVKEFLARVSDYDHMKYITVIPVDKATGETTQLTSPISIQIPGQAYPFSISPSDPGGLGQSSAAPSRAGSHVGSVQGSGMFTPQSMLNVANHSHGKHKKSKTRSNYSESFSGSDSDMDNFNANFSGRLSAPPSLVISGPEDTEKNKLRIPANFMTAGTESDNESEMTKKRHAQLLVSKFAKMGGGTFNRHALSALKQLDAAVAAEVSDLENLTVAADDISTRNGEASPAIVPPPPPPPPPPVAPPPPAPPMPGSADPKAQTMNVKRINWEKLDQGRLENTIWQQIGDGDLEDVVRYLELEQYFSTKSPKQPLQSRYKKNSKLRRLPEKKNEVCILNAKKSYNISILLGHLKLSLTDVRQALYLMDETILTPELLRQLLAYAPNKNEMEQLDSFNGNIEELSKPDRFTYEMSRVPGYEQRLKALVFKGNFQEKITEMKEHLQYIRKASLELRHSKKLSKILELILAMGNYMNQGNQRVGEAAGFKIRFLSQLEITKTSDNKLTFLHVLAEAVHGKFPELVAVGEELTTVPQASKYSDVLLNQELQDLRKVLQDISNTLEKFGSQKTSLGINDKFQDVMGHFISQASDEIQGLFRLNANTMEEFQATVQYFGEDPKKVTTTELFGVFADFVTKFEKAHRHNMMFKRFANDKP